MRRDPRKCERDDPSPARDRDHERPEAVGSRDDEHQIQKDPERERRVSPAPSTLDDCDRGQREQRRHEVALMNLRRQQEEGEPLEGQEPEGARGRGRRTAARGEPAPPDDPDRREQEENEADHAGRDRPEDGEIVSRAGSPPRPTSGPSHAPPEVPRIHGDHRIDAARPRVDPHDRGGESGQDEGKSHDDRGRRAEEQRPEDSSRPGSAGQ